MEPAGGSACSGPTRHSPWPVPATTPTSSMATSAIPSPIGRSLPEPRCRSFCLSARTSCWTSWTSPQYVFYLDTKGERCVNNTFRGQVHVALERVYLQAGGGMSDVRRRFSPELDINVREKRDSADGTFLWQASKTASLAILYERSKYDYGDAEYLDSNLSEMLNRNEDHVDVIAYIQPGPGTRLLLDGQYGLFAFTGATSGVRDAKSYGIFGGAEFIPGVGETPIGSGLRGGFKLGYTRLDLVDPGLRDGSGFAGEANVAADLTNRTSLQLFFSRGFQFSDLLRRHILPRDHLPGRPVAAPVAEGRPLLRRVPRARRLSPGRGYPGSRRSLRGPRGQPEPQAGPSSRRRLDGHIRPAGSGRRRDHTRPVFRRSRPDLRLSGQRNAVVAGRVGPIARILRMDCPTEAIYNDRVTIEGDAYESLLS